MAETLTRRYQLMADCFLHREVGVLRYIALEKRSVWAQFSL